jgi:hypothetical protein
MRKHQTEECEEIDVECDFKSIGCDYTKVSVLVHCTLYKAMDTPKTVNILIILMAALVIVEVKFKPHHNILYWHIINSPPKQNEINDYDKLK